MATIIKKIRELTYDRNFAAVPVYNYAAALRTYFHPISGEVSTSVEEYCSIQTRC
jgi:hypothetical protein